MSQGLLLPTCHNLQVLKDQLGAELIEERETIWLENHKEILLLLMNVNSVMLLLLADVLPVFGRLPLRSYCKS